MAYFDTNNDGSVNFDEFLVGIRVRDSQMSFILCIGQDER